MRRRSRATYLYSSAATAASVPVRRVRERGPSSSAAKRRRSRPRVRTLAASRSSATMRASSSAARCSSSSVSEPLGRGAGAGAAGREGARYCAGTGGAGRVASRAGASPSWVEPPWSRRRARCRRRGSLAPATLPGACRRDVAPGAAARRGRTRPGGPLLDSGPPAGGPVPDLSVLVVALAVLLAALGARPGRPAPTRRPPPGAGSTTSPAASDGTLADVLATHLDSVAVVGAARTSLERRTAALEETGHRHPPGHRARPLQHVRGHRRQPELRARALDPDGNGVVLTSLHARNRTRVYAKASPAVRPRARSPPRRPRRCASPGPAAGR